MTWIREKTVVVPLDMSEFSLAAFAAAVELATDFDQIRVLHVLPEFDRAGLENRLEQCRAALSALLQQQGYQKPNITVRVGDPIKQILVFADDVDAGLIVMPSHGRGVLTEMLLGSTTYTVVRRSTCPVLILKPTKMKR